MQMSAPEVLNLSEETSETQALYGIGNKTTELYGRRLLAARRLAERGVRFTLCYLSDYGEWDSHSNIKELHARSCGRVVKDGINGLLLPEVTPAAIAAAVRKVAEAPAMLAGFSRASGIGPNQGLDALGRALVSLEAA